MKPDAPAKPAYVRNNVLIYALIASAVFGLISTIRNFYPSGLFIPYVLMCLVCLGLVYYSKIYADKITAKQTIALIPIVFFGFIGWLVVEQNLRLGWFLFTSSLFLFAGVVLLNTGRKVWAVIFAICFLISSFSIIPAIIYAAEGFMITRDVIGVLFITNSEEASAYLRTNTSYLQILLPVIFLIFSILLFYRPNKDYQPAKPFALKVLFVTAFITSTMASPLAAVVMEYVTFRKDRALLKELYTAREKTLADQKYTTSADSNSAKKIVVVIGESLNRDYMSLYGYKLNTTPYLKQLYQSPAKDGRLFILNNAISPEVQTVETLTKVLTNSSVENPIPFTESVGLMRLFTKAGYNTYWISNQAPYGKWDTPVAIISSSAKTTYFTSQDGRLVRKGSRMVEHFDMDVVEKFDEFISRQDTSQNQLFVIHLRGSHVDYYDRFPESFNRFKTSDQMKNEYLNSVLYNDHVLKNILRISKKYNVDLVSYFADHGEVLGHMHNPSNYLKGMSTIPYMYYLSKEYLSKNPQLAETLTRKINTPIMTDNYFHDLQYISGVKSSLFDSTKTFLSQSYKPKKRMVVGGKIPFDKR